MAVALDGCWANAIIPTVRLVGSLSPQTFLGRIQSQTCCLAKPDVVRLLHTVLLCARCCERGLSTCPAVAPGCDGHTTHWQYSSGATVISEGLSWNVYYIILVQFLPSSCILYFCMLYETQWKVPVKFFCHTQKIITVPGGMHVQLFASPADGLPVRGASWLMRTNVRRWVLLIWIWVLAR